MNQVLEETNASGTAQADYIYLNGRPVAALNGSTLYYLHDDRLGTPQLAIYRSLRSGPASLPRKFVIQVRIRIMWRDQTY
jgi:hypothetical protein